MHHAEKQAMLMELVNVIFKKLSLRYGRDFMGRYEGLDELEVKSDWALELDGFEKAPHAILYAFQNLPDSKPPNVAEFRSIARRAPSAQVVVLEAPRANPAVVSKALAEARALLQRARA